MSPATGSDTDEFARIVGNLELDVESWTFGPDHGWPDPPTEPADDDEPPEDDPTATALASLDRLARDEVIDYHIAKARMRAAYRDEVANAATRKHRLLRLLARLGWAPFGWPPRRAPLHVWHTRIENRRLGYLGPWAWRAQVPIGTAGTVRDDYAYTIPDPKHPHRGRIAHRTVIYHFARYQPTRATLAATFALLVLAVLNLAALAGWQLP